MDPLQCVQACLHPKIWTHCSLEGCMHAYTPRYGLIAMWKAAGMPTPLDMDPLQCGRLQACLHPHIWTVEGCRHAYTPRYGPIAVWLGDEWTRTANSVTLPGQLVAQDEVLNHVSCGCQTVLCCCTKFTLMCTAFGKCLGQEECQNPMRVASSNTGHR